jgi:AcrR family transcriptional regulator
MGRARVSEEERRQQIVRAARRLIVRHGYSHTTLAQVAAEVGVSKGLVSYYFAKKDALFLAVLDSMLSRLRDDLDAVYRRDLPAWERLKLNLKNLFGSEKRTKQYYGLLIEFLAEAPREKEISEYTRVIYQTHLTYIERTIDDGITAGEFASVDAGAEGSMLVALMEGMILQWMYAGESRSFIDAYHTCETVAACRLMPGGSPPQPLAER